MKRFVFVLALSILVVFSLFSQINATVTEISGRVEVKLPKEEWKPAEVGMNLSNGTFISTGFKSEAKLLVGPSEVNVRQLTRMELDQLVAQGDTLTTGINLRVGNLRANVNTAEGLSNDFQIRTPVSTAAVRGTQLDLSLIHISEPTRPY